MVDPHPSTDVALITGPSGVDREPVNHKHTKAENKDHRKEGKAQEAVGKAAEREQKIRWDADKIQLKWVRLAILMAGIGFGADQTLHQLGQGTISAVEFWMLRAVAQTLGVVGLVALGIATVQHGRLLSAVSRDRPMPVARFPLSLVVAVIVILLGVVVMAISVISLGAVRRAAVITSSDRAGAGTAVVVATPVPVVPPPTLAPDARSQPVAASLPPSPVAVVTVSMTAVRQPTTTPASQPTPIPAATVEAATPVTLAVQGTGSAGARLRQAPVDGEIITLLPDGTRLTALDETSSEGDQTWQRVRTEDGHEGWIAADFVVSVSP